MVSKEDKIKSELYVQYDEKHGPIKKGEEREYYRKRERWVQERYSEQMAQRIPPRKHEKTPQAELDKRRKEWEKDHKGLVGRVGEAINNLIHPKEKEKEEND